MVLLGEIYSHPQIVEENNSEDNEREGTATTAVRHAVHRQSNTAGEVLKVGEAENPLNEGMDMVDSYVK